VLKRTSRKGSANKYVRQLLGRDARWLRPKNAAESQRRMDGLRNGTLNRPGFSNTFIPSFDSYKLGENLPPSSRETAVSRQISDADMVSAPNPKEKQVSGPDGRAGTSIKAFDHIMHRLTSPGPVSPTSITGDIDDDYSLLRSKLDACGRLDIDTKDIYRILTRLSVSNHDQSNFTLNDNPHAPDPQPFEAQGRPAPFQLPSPSTLLNVASFPWSEAKLGGPSITVRGKGGDETLNLLATDPYGNTCFHLLAATEEWMPQLLFLLEDVQEPVSSVVKATNSAGQTMAHVLHESCFSEPRIIAHLLQLLQPLGFNFFALDDYGRTFFHVWAFFNDNTKERIDFANELQPGHFSELNRRDAIGIRPLDRSRSQDQPNSTRLKIPSTNEFFDLEKGTRLLRLVTRASDSPDMEDEDGRNPLHALAEVLLLDGLGLGFDYSDKRSLRAKTSSLKKRSQYLETLLETKVDVNHYNRSGETVLMAFISQCKDGEDDATLEDMIRRLVSAGADINRRNRLGETALHVAVKLGQKFVVKLLLQLGANPCARNAAGLGVLQVCETLTREEGDDFALYARVQACRAVLLTERMAGDVPLNPTTEQEWLVKK
jgi:ankyrin repeat protein